MGSNTDFARVQGWFAEHRDYHPREFVEYAEVLRDITGHGVMIVDDELKDMKDLLIGTVGAQWADYNEEVLRGEWRNLWTPAGDPREVVKRALMPFDEAREHLIAAQLAFVKAPRALERHLEPIGRPKRPARRVRLDASAEW